MSLSHPDTIALMQIDGVTSIREKRGEALVIGLATPDAKATVQQALNTRGIEQAVRFLLPSRNTGTTDAD